MRLIYKACGKYGINNFAKVYWNREWREYLVKLFIDGIHMPKADYFTNDKADAISTANRMMAKMEGK